MNHKSVQRLQARGQGSLRERAFPHEASVNEFKKDSYSEETLAKALVDHRVDRNYVRRPFSDHVARYPDNISTSLS